MAKYVDLPNLKENLTNFLNKKINPIYAKKTEIPSNISELNNDKSYQTAEEVGKAVTDGVAKIVAGAPEDFDTLKEMSDWISSHETSAAAMNSAISDNSVAIANHTSNSDIHVTKAEKIKWDNKVDSVEGKTLSNNNFLYKYKDALDKMPTTYQYKTHYNKEDGTFNMVSIDAGSQGTDPQTFQKYTLPSNYKDIFDGVNSKIEDLALNGVYSNKVDIDQVNSNLTDLKVGEVAGGKNLFNPKCLLNATYDKKTYTITVSSNNYKALDMVFKENTKYTFSAYIKQNSSSTNIRLKIRYTDGTLSNALFTQSTSEVYLSETSKSGKTISEVQWEFGNNGTATFRNFQIEEGDTATQYEPYIPSVKMLAEEVKVQNSNLSDLKVSDVAGGKNLLDPNYFTSQIVKAGGTGNVDGVSWDCAIVNTFVEDLSGIQFKENTVYTIVLYGKCKNSEQLISNLNIEYTDGTKSTIMFSSKNTNSLALRVTDSNKTISKLVFYYGSIGTDLDPKKCGIFEGTIKESDFEPYIPSVKMLSDEVSALEDYGLKADKPELIQGFYDISNDGIYKEGNLFICNKNAISCESVDKITVITGKEYYCRMVFYNENTFVSSEVNSVKSKKNVYVVPENVTKANFYFAKGDGNAFSLSELGYCSVYINNAIDEIKNDLSNLKDGTTPAAKAVADEDGNNIKSTYAKKTEAFIDYSHISVDLNTLTKAPSLISIGYDIDNKPPKFMGGYMLVVNAGYPASIALYQILFDVYYNKTYQRKYYHGSWSAWSDVTTPQDVETTTLTTTSGTATLYKLGKMRHLVLNNATFSSINVIASTDASVGSLYFRAEVLFNSGDDLEGGSASFEDICISGSNMWNATRTATGASPVAVKGATGSATWMVQ